MPIPRKSTAANTEHWLTFRNWRTPYRKMPRISMTLRQYSLPGCL